MLTTAVILLFVVSAVGGFVATRAIGQQSIPPPPRTQSSAQPVPVPTTFERQEADASNVKGQPAKFTIDVPEGWQQFSSPGVGDNLPPSTIIKWVSPDGAQMLAVDHIANYHDVGAYLSALSRSRKPEILANNGLADPANGVEFFYRTLDGVTGSNAVLRTTFTKIFDRGNGLWAVGVTVPGNQGDSARTALYDRIVPSFQVEN